MPEETREGFLKFIIFYKGLMGIVEIISGLALLTISGTNNEMAQNILAKTGLEHTDALGWIIAVLLVFGVMNLVEGWGLHIRRRWAEWLTVIATAVFIPFEIMDLFEKPSITMLIILALNCAIVYYLAKHKELFHTKKEELIDESKELQDEDNLTRM